ncbi:hypothetical protein BKA61DRAFT_709635 [Leptodontidium sp. MPI-SDFR-AT-0119]|nr:hypothetical protein BKA61DRAFT_709635 [Leptodontidium sp. MPI-SDFR-AT-0119]
MAPARQQNVPPSGDYNSDTDDLHARYARELESLRAKHELEVRQAKELADLKAKFEEEKIARKKSRKRSSGLTADERPAKKMRTGEDAGPATNAGQAVEGLPAAEMGDDEKARPAINTDESVEHRPEKKMGSEGNVRPVIKNEVNYVSNIIVLDDSDDESPLPQYKPRKSKAAKSSDTIKDEPSRFDAPSSIKSPTTKPFPAISTSGVAQDVHANGQQIPKDTRPPSHASIIQSLQAYPMLLTKPRESCRTLRRIHEVPLVRELELRPGKSFDVKNHRAKKSALMYTRGEPPLQGACKSCATARTSPSRGPYQKCIIMHVGNHWNKGKNKTQVPNTLTKEGSSDGEGNEYEVESDDELTLPRG